MAAPSQIDPRIYSPPAAAHRQQSAGATAAGLSFAQELAHAQDGQGAQGLRFSNHAQKRLQTREISLSDDGLARLASAVEKAEKRGGRESLVLMDELAFIVNVPDRLVVTAIDPRSRGEGVFTQIDSVVIADKV
jgi:flagellar operon protein